MRKNKKKRKFLIKIILLILVLTIFYGLYLYIKISKFINGRVWNFPVKIYSRIVDLEPGNMFSLKEIETILKHTMYKKVNNVMLPGEYSIKNSTIEFIRRSFDFPDIQEHEFHAKLFFEKDFLKKIVNVENNRNFSFFRLEPKLISILHSPEKKNVFLFLMTNIQKC